MRTREKSRWARKILFPPGSGCLPEQVIFFVTDKCNLGCAHCFNWANLNKEANEATLEEIKEFSGSMGPFSFLTLTGGEPFLRNDIPDIIDIFGRNNSVSRVNIPTNGFFTEKILKNTETIVRDARDIDLAVKISLDGLAHDHDAIRGAQGVFAKAIDTYHGLAHLKKTYPRLKTGIIITYSTLNQAGLPGLLDYIEDKLDPDTISLTLLRGSVKDPRCSKGDVSNYLKTHKRILSFLMHKKNMQTGFSSRFYRAFKTRISKMVADTANRNRFFLPCHAGRLLCVIDSSLNVYPCEILKKGFGNLRDSGYDFQKLWFSRNAELLRHEIKDSRCCCTYECGLQITAFFDLKTICTLIPDMLWPT